MDNSCREGCRVDAECPVNNVCSNGDCLSQCLNSDQCNAGQYCEGAQGNTPEHVRGRLR